MILSRKKVLDRYKKFLEKTERRTHKDNNTAVIEIEIDKATPPPPVIRPEKDVPKVSLKLNGKSKNAQDQKGKKYTIKWSSQNSKKCELTYRDKKHKKKKVKKKKRAV